MNKDELKFYFREEWNNFIRTIRYFLLEPFLIAKRLLIGRYTNMILFWSTISILIFSWRNKHFDKNIKIIVLLALLIYIYIFHKSGRAQEYYEKEYIEGKKLE